MLTASGTYSLYPGQKKTHASSVTITLTATFDKVQDAYTCYVTAAYSGTPEGGTILTYTKANLTAYTSSGADDILKAFNLCEQAVKGTLEGYAENSGVTFTIS